MAQKTGTILMILKHSLSENAYSTCKRINMWNAIELFSNKYSVSFLAIFKLILVIALVQVMFLS